MSETNKIIDEAIVSILTRAVTFDKSGRYTESLICYQEGLQLLMESFKGTPSGNIKDAIKRKIEEYMSRAEEIKKIVLKKKEEGSFHEEIIVAQNSKGNGYESIMGRYMDNDVEVIQITDPYIRNHNQFCNLLHFCEVAVKKCANLKVIKLLTNSASCSSKDQLLWFSSLAEDLENNHKIKFLKNCSDVLHDREILFSNGWVIKIGRGLDYFQKPSTRFGLGKFDWDFRQCLETKIDIYFQKNITAASILQS